MQRKVPKPNFDVVGSLESFNTDRTEIAPRSDVIREDFQNHFRLVVHEASFGAGLVATIGFELRDFHDVGRAVILVASQRAVKLGHPAYLRAYRHSPINHRMEN